MGLLSNISGKKAVKMFGKFGYILAYRKSYDFISWIKTNALYSRSQRAGARIIAWINSKGWINSRRVFQGKIKPREYGVSTFGAKRTGEGTLFLFAP